jgi:hypothetical protein
MRAAIIVLIALLAPPCVFAQSASPSGEAHERIASLTAGLGNSMAWAGVSGQVFVVGDYLSVFASAGHPLGGNAGAPSLAGAAGLRAFSGGQRHRRFLELSVSPLAILAANRVFIEQFYGPGASVGYEYTALEGLAFAASLGGGLVLQPHGGVDRIQPLLTFSVGRTWRR